MTISDNSEKIYQLSNLGYLINDLYSKTKTLTALRSLGKISECNYIELRMSEIFSISRSLKVLLISDPSSFANRELPTLLNSFDILYHELMRSIEENDNDLTFDSSNVENFEQNYNLLNQLLESNIANLSK